MLAFTKITHPTILKWMYIHRLLMKYLTILLFFIPISLYGQKSLKTPYQHKMDSAAISNLNLKYTEQGDKEFEQNYLLKKVKLTFATRVNTDDLSDLGFDLDGEYQEDNDDGFNDASTDDYLSVFKYDLRAKFYITRDIRFISRVVIMGTKYRTNQYSAGFFIKF